MSSILDALRKVEQEKVEVAQPVPVDLDEEVAERDLIGGAVGGRGLTLHIAPSVLLVVGLAAGLVLAGGSVAGGLLWMRGPSVAPPTTVAQAAPEAEGAAPVQVSSLVPAPALQATEVNPVPAPAAPADPEEPEPVSAAPLVVVREEPPPPAAVVAPAPAPRAERPAAPLREREPAPKPPASRREPDPAPARRSLESRSPAPAEPLVVAEVPATFTEDDSEPVAREPEPLASPVEPAAAARVPSGAAQPPTAEDRQRIKLNMPRPANRQRPYASAIINLQPVFVNDKIPGTDARLVGVTESGIEYVNEDKGTRHFMAF